MASSKVSSFPYKDKHQSSQLTIGIFYVWFLLIVGLQEVSATVGDPCSTPLACSNPGEICITATNECGCSADYYQSTLDDSDCQPMNELIVTRIQAPQRFTDRVTLTWLTNKHGTNVTYTIYPRGGRPPVSNITGNTSTVTGLTPGTQYTFIVTSVLPAAGFYPEKSVNSTTSSGFWTKPAKPGAVTDIQLVSEQPVIHDITFMASQGQVSHYAMTVNSVTRQSTGSATTVRVTSLQQGHSYNYSIIAYNGNNDPSEPSTGTLTTPVIASGPVTDLMVSEITSHGSKVTWKKPTRPNGDITSYTLTVMEGSVCVYGHIISCSDCPTPGSPSNTASCMKTNSESKTSAALNNDTRPTTFTVEVSDLEPYRNYTDTVTADNLDGIGMASYFSFTTLVAAARDVTDVLATSRRNNGTGVVSLTVTWTPGYFTGPTNYEVTLEEETSLGSGSFKVIAVETVTGYDNKTWTNTPVLAYWTHRIYVKAMTAAGNSSVVGPRAVRTETTSPGLPQVVTVQQDEIVAQELALTIACPEEKERNGFITGYIIRKTLVDATGSGMQTEYMVATDSSRTCINTYRANYVGGITVEHNYTFAVKVRNTDFSGSFSPESFLYVEPRAPRFEELIQDYGVSSLVRQQKGSTIPQTAIDVSVCTSCLLDNRQGTVENVGLVVCKVGSDDQCMYGGRKRRSLVNIWDYTTWSTARSQSFRVPYRATLDDWISSLTSPNTSYPYRIGTDRNCRTDADTVYCNGPLPSDTSFRVAVIQCNSAGCVIGTFEGPFRTGPADSENATLPIALGVAIPVVIIIAIIIIVVVIKRKQSNQHKREEDQRSYNTMNTAMTDAHLYHGVTGRAYVSPTHTNPNGQDNIAMAGLQTHQASLQQRDNTEYTEPDHYDYIYDSGHQISENQPSQRHDRVGQPGKREQNPYKNYSVPMNAQRKRDYYNIM